MSELKTWGVFFERYILERKKYMKSKIITKQMEDKQASGEEWEHEDTYKLPKKIRSTGLSACHKAEMTVVGSGGGTMYYECNSCHSPCDMWSSTTQETTKQMEDWEKEFIDFAYMNPDFPHSTPEECKKLIGFIRSLLSSQKPDLKEKIEEWINGLYTPETTKGYYETVKENRAFNSALDVLSVRLKEFLKTL